ncbi:MAG: energy transducer TonB [Cellvibrionaceae bacterium]
MSVYILLPSSTLVRRFNPVLVAAAVVSLVFHALWLFRANTTVNAVSLSGQAKSAVAVSLTHLTLVSKPNSTPLVESSKSQAKNDESSTDTPSAMPAPRAVLMDEAIESIDSAANQNVSPALPATEQAENGAQSHNKQLPLGPLSSEEASKAIDRPPEAEISSNVLSETALKDELSRIRKNPSFSRPPTSPRYPSIAIKRHWQGEVVVHALVDARGDVSDLLVKHSSGFPVLDRSALEAVKGWNFEPTLVRGKSVPSWIEVPVEFSLRR